MLPCFVVYLEVGKALKQLGEIECAGLACRMMRLQTRCHWC